MRIILTKQFIFIKKGKHLSQLSSDSPSFNLSIICSNTKECIEVQIKQVDSTHKYCVFDTSGKH